MKFEPSPPDIKPLVKGKGIEPGQSEATVVAPTNNTIMEIVYRNLAELKPHPDNPRKPKPGSIPELAESIQSKPNYFEARPVILSNRTGELVIIDGERRSEAARYLGMSEIPTILMEGLTYEDELEILIKGNTHSGIWDTKKLTKWSKDQLQKWNVEGLKDLQTKKDRIKADVPFCEILNEEHNYVVLFFDNTVDWLQAKSLLELQTVKRHPTSVNGNSEKFENTWMGEGRVINGARAFELLRRKFKENED